MDQSAQCIAAADHSRASMPTCVKRFSRASFGKRKTLSLQNLGGRRFCLHSNIGRVWHVRAARSISKILKSAAKHFVGTHDFAGFAANRGKREKSTIRTIYSVRVRKNGPFVTIDFDGDGFLYKMIRLMVGSLVKCALGKLRCRRFDCAAALRPSGLARFAAPAEGLFLVRVRY